MKKLIIRTLCLVLCLSTLFAMSAMSAMSAMAASVPTIGPAIYRENDGTIETADNGIITRYEVDKNMTLTGKVVRYTLVEEPEDTTEEVVELCAAIAMLPNGDVLASDDPLNNFIEMKNGSWVVKEVPEGACACCFYHFLYCLLPDNLTVVNGVVCATNQF